VKFRKRRRSSKRTNHAVCCRRNSRPTAETGQQKDEPIRLSMPGLSPETSWNFYLIEGGIEFGYWVLFCFFATSESQDSPVPSRSAEGLRGPEARLLVLDPDFTGGRSPMSCPRRTCDGCPHCKRPNIWSLLWRDFQWASSQVSTVEAQSGHWDTPLTQRTASLRSGPRCSRRPLEIAP